MSYNYPDHHHRQFDHSHTQLWPNPEFSHWTVLPHSFDSFQPPPKHVPAVWYAEGGEPWQFDHPQPPPYAYNAGSQPPDPPDWLFNPPLVQEGFLPQHTLPPDQLDWQQQSDPAFGHQSPSQTAPYAATLEYILATLARFETRLDEQEHRLAAMFPPSHPEPVPRPCLPLQPLAVTTPLEVEKENDRLVEEVKLSEKRYKELTDEKIVNLGEKRSVEGQVKELRINVDELRPVVAKLEGLDVAYVDNIRSFEYHVGEYKCILEKAYVRREDSLDHERQNALKLMPKIEELEKRKHARLQSCAFDPGGENSELSISPAMFVVFASWFPP